MNLKKKLQNILQDIEKDSIKADVIETVLDSASTNEEIKNFFNDITQHGCVSGMIPHLIYYTDTQKYFIDHESEIEDIIEEYTNEVGNLPKPKGKLSNWYSWFAFEWVAYQLASELNLN